MANDNHVSRKKNPKLRLVQVLVLAALIGGAFFIWFNRKAEQDVLVDQLALPIRVEKAQKRDLAQTLRLSAWLDSEQNITLTSKVSGLVQSLKAEVGQQVAEDQILAVLDQESQRLSLDQASSAYDQARINFERTQSLQSSGAASDQALDQAQVQYSNAKAQYELAKLNYDNTVIRAPVQGTIIKRYAQKGALISPSSPLFVLAGLDNLSIKAEVPEQYAVDFLEKEKNIRAWAEIPALKDAVFPVKLTSVSPYIKPESRTMEVQCSLDTQGRSLVPGMFIRLFFALDSRENVYALPREVLVKGSDLWIYKPESASLEKIDVSSSFMDEHYVEIPQAYADAWFVTQGQQVLKETSSVRLLGEDLAQSPESEARK